MNTVYEIYLMKQMGLNILPEYMFRNVITVLESNTWARDYFLRCRTCVRDFTPV